MAEMRLQKFISSAGVCSRRKAEAFIMAGRVKVNGQTVTALGVKVDPDQDAVEIDGKVVRSLVAPVYIALNKPKGYVSSCDHKGEKIVLDLLDTAVRVYPVGRLDKDSTGLLLLTNDGHLHHRLSHPSFAHEKEYEVSVTAPLTAGAMRKLAQGLPLMGKRTRPARLKRISPRRFRIVLQEGKNRQIRRMVRKVGSHVSELKRIRMANIRLGNLPSGAWRYLTQKERNNLFEML